MKDMRAQAPGAEVPSETPVATPAVDFAELDRLRAQVAVLQAEKAQLQTGQKSELEALRAQVKELQENNGSETGRYPLAFQTTSTKPTWPFVVSVKGEKYKHMPVLTIRAVDESEAHRLYLVHPEVTNGAYGDPGKALDSLKYNLDVTLPSEIQTERKRHGFEAKRKRNIERGYADPALLPPVHGTVAGMAAVPAMGTQAA